MRPLGIWWRGPLESCNYACGYCPFAKRPATAERLAADRAALERFVGWAAGADRALEVLFTPFGEALIWPWYREALVRLSHLPHARRVGIQTNGSAPVGWVDDADRRRLSLWISWHPSEVALAPFLARVEALHARGVDLSVGVVARPEHLEGAEALRAALPRRCGSG